MNSNSAIRYFRHAMVLDERRATYHVNHWHPGSPHDLGDAHNQKTDVREVWFAGCHSGILPSFLSSLREKKTDIVTAQTLVEVLSRTRRGTASPGYPCAG
jgi:uncharacterized protein (DUF2235 family)